MAGQAAEESHMVFYFSSLPVNVREKGHNYKYCLVNLRFRGQEEQHVQQTAISNLL